MKLMKPAIFAAAAAMLMPVGFSSTATAQEPIIGEVMDFGGNFCPRGWASTDGQLLAITNHTALFSLMGTTYGGDGRTTFALPKRSSSIMVGGSPAVAAVPGTPATGAPAGGGEARLHQHCWGNAGWSAPLGLGTYKLADMPAAFINNDASAVSLSPGWSITLYDGPGATGNSITLDGSDDCLVGEDFNDMVSSVKVTRSAGTPATAGTPARAAVPGKLAGKSCIAITGIYPSRS